MTNFNIQFTPEIVALLPILINSNWKEIVEEEKIPYSYIYMKKLASGQCNFSPKVNQALNELWAELGLDMNSLNDLYTLSDIIAKAEANRDYMKKNGGIK